VPARPLTAAEVAALLRDFPTAFLSYGAHPSGDRDGAFDDAVDQAGYDYGHASTTPSVAAVAAGAVAVLQSDPVPVRRAALLAVRALAAGQLRVKQAYAIPVCPDSTVIRRRQRLTLQDPAVDLGQTIGPLAVLDGPRELLLRSAAAAGGATLGAAEFLESAELVRSRARYKPVVTVHRGPGGGEFVVLDPATGQLMSRGHRTAGDARRAAAAAAKAGPIGGNATGTLEIRKLSGRSDGRPLIQVTRTRVAETAAVKTVWATVRPAAKTKIVGWVFVGFLGDPGDTSDGEPGSAVPPPGPSGAGAAAGDQGSESDVLLGVGRAE
jgi:hypothetical protein